MRFLTFLISASLLVGPLQAAYLLVPPNAQEILNVLGPDAQGLHLHADALPDLFTLTASRLEEDPKLFIVEEPYFSGHWQGGKAVIEYARDLSYTQVSIYDRYGQRQRIYAVRSKLEEAKQKDEKRHAEALLLQAQNAYTNPPADKVQDEDEDRPRRRHPVIAPPPPSAEFEEAASEPEQKTSAPAPIVQAPATTSVPVKTVAVPVPPSVASAPTKTIPAKASAVASVPPSVSSVKTAAAPPTTVPDIEDVAEVGPHVEWDEARGAYVSVNVKVVAAATPTTAPRVAVTEALPPPAPVPAAVAVAPKKSAPRQVVGPPVDLHPAPEATGEWTDLNQELDKGEKKGEPPLSQQLAAKPASQTPPVESPPVYSKAVVPPVNVNALPAAAPAPAPSPVQVAALSVAIPEEMPAAVTGPVVAPVPTPSPKKTKKAKRGHADVQPAPEQVIVPSSDAYDLPADKKPTDSALAAATASLAHQPAPVTPVQIPGVTPTAPAPGKQSLDSDAWTPSNAKPTPEEEFVVQEKKKAIAPDTSIDGLMKVASLNEGAVPNEAAMWVPKPAALPAPDADIHEELSRVQGEKKTTVAPIVKINRDINNPEEGVLPVNAFEKSSGSRYGRHREYERRIFFAKKSGSHVAPKSYDFYVDETDRKKETHNVYYYVHESKGRPPRLVAVEKHTRVTFLSNYDVDKEDKGKVSTY